MGENSAYYNSLNQRRRNATNSVKALLPQYAKGFIDECLLEHQLNTAYSYAHDILFFTSICRKEIHYVKNLK